MLSKEFQQLIIDHKRDQKIKDSLLSASGQEQLVTPLIESISSLLLLEFGQKLKLNAYPEEALNHAYDYLKKIINGTIPMKDLDDGYSWFLNQAKNYCIKNNLESNWKFAYALLEIHGIDSNKFDTPKPLKIKKTFKAPTSKIISQPKFYKEQTTTRTTEFLQKEISAFRDMVTNPFNYFKPNAVWTLDEWVAQTKIFLDKCIAELQPVSVDSY